ncbi:hypothetical protein BC939DRAFT_469938 [Gamsiella multidivaricata]|uniref:uncharacterized protein n=1 Tax=Gamsiella multidivaricata TaxID=101098 RepID=UPI00222094FE|nr:uncharacterized protein BC939DRAFT_469938 [Gamsiella multidivaricata]KAI7816200.1 hypothetical protein BC939DRAFT_469938 [Gamsiella multidivaricata]
MLTESRSSSIRFSNIPHPPPLEENGKDGLSQGTPAQRYPSPISGSMFLPPKVAVSPPTPLPPSGSSSIPAAPVPAISLRTPSGPLVAGGSFFARPRFRSPSTSTAASGDIMEINDPGHVGRTVVAIEPVQQQPLYSLYVPPLPQHHAPKSIPLSSYNHAPTSLPIPGSTFVTATNSNASPTANVTGSNLSHQKEISQLTNSDEDDSPEASRQDIVDNDAQDNDGIRPAPPPPPSVKPKRGGLFGLGKLFGPKDTESRRERQQGHPSSRNLRTLTSESSSSTTPLQPASTPESQPLSTLTSEAVVFNRTKHPTRISEGEEEEDTEETRAS